MARPKIPRRIECHPPASCFKPNGVPMSQLVRVELAPDELEALRLVDQLGLQQQQAALQMQVSRQTLANLVKAARFKVVDCLLHQKVLYIQSMDIDPSD
ncbi:HTH DNA-binding protein [Vibrio cholerae]|nr:HTH DNA-binding protein [Vibrio cholerae]